MTFSDYLLNGALIALVLLQVRGRRLSIRTLLLPLGIVTWAATQYLHGVPTAGNDLALESAGVTAGLALGVGCGLATSLFRRDDGVAMARAGLLAASLWVLGVGARVAFSLYATHGGGGAIERFSASHHITSTQAWVTTLILMALVEVVSRNAVLFLRMRALGLHLSAPVPAPVSVPVSVPVAVPVPAPTSAAASAADPVLVPNPAGGRSPAGPDLPGDARRAMMGNRDPWS